jgi:hypothetical protein
MTPASPVTKALANHAGGQPSGKRFVSGMALLVFSVITGGFTLRACFELSTARYQCSQCRVYAVEG